jgi:hypothetical protein
VARRNFSELLAQFHLDKRDREQESLLEAEAREPVS